MRNQRTTYLFITLVILAVATLIGLTWANSHYVLQNPGGNDFLPHWAATRLFLLEGVSPYSDQATLEINNPLYTGVAQADEEQDLFLYPFYTIYLMAPFSLIPDYALARAIWMTVLEISIVGLVLISVSLSRWKIPVWMLAILIFFSVFWYFSVSSIIDGNLSVILAVLIGLAFMAIRARNDGLAGFLLALTAIKPQTMILLAIYVLIWSAVQKRWHLFWGFLSSLAFLIATSFLFIPDWLLQNLRNIFAFFKNADMIAPRQILLQALPGVGNQLGWAITIVMIAALIVEWRASAKKDFTWFYWTALLTLAATPLSGIPAGTSNFILFYPALVLIFSAWETHWKTAGKLLIAFSMLLFFFGYWWLSLRINPLGVQTIQNPAMFFPLPVFVFVSLYWVRWWVLRPTRPLLERYRRLDVAQR